MFIENKVEAGMRRKCASLLNDLDERKQRGIVEHIVFGRDDEFAIDASEAIDLIYDTIIDQTRIAYIKE